MIEFGVTPLVLVPRGTMRRTLLVILAMLFVTAQAVTRSQSGTPQRPAVDITNADIRATIKTAPTDVVTDQQIRVVDIAWSSGVSRWHQSVQEADDLLSTAGLNLRAPYRSATSASTVALDGGRADAARHGVNSK